MGSNIVKMPSLNAVAAGQTATLDVPLGPTYRTIFLECRTAGTLMTEAEMKSDIGDIRIKIAGKEQRTHSAAQVLEMLKIYGLSVNAGIIPLIFAEPWRRTPQGTDFLAWGTQDVPTFQIEVDIDSGSTSPTVAASAEISRARLPLGIIKRVRRFKYGPSGTGDFQVQNLPKIGTSYAALHLFETTAADVSSVLVEVDQNKVWDTPAFMADAVYDQNEISAQSGIFSVVFDFDRRTSSPLPLVYPNGQMVSDLLVTANMAVADPFTIVTEEFGPRF